MAPLSTIAPQGKKKEKIYNPWTDKMVNIDPYGRRAKDIYRYFIKEGIDAESILPPLLTYVNGRFRKLKPIVNWTGARRITYAMIDGLPMEVNQTTYMKNILKGYAGKTIKVAKKYTIQYDGVILEIEEAETIDVPPVKQGFSSWWKKWFFLYIDSNTWLFSEDINEYDEPELNAQLIIMDMDKVESGDYKQYFLDGTSHCVFQPILDWAIQTEEDAKSRTAKYRYRRIQKEAKKYMLEYKKGVPAEDIPIICNHLQISIEIDIPSTLNTETTYIECVSQKKPLKKFRFINTRLNHIEINSVNTKDNYLEVSKEELKKIYDDARKKNEFVMWKDSKAGLLQVNTLDCVYKLTSEEGYSKAVKDFEELNKLRDIKIEHYGNRKLSTFLMDNLNCNGNLWFNENGVNQSLFEELIDTKETSDDYILELHETIHKEIVEYAETQKKKYEWWEKWSVQTIDGLTIVLNVIKKAIECRNNLKHIDIKKAYSQGHKCVKYQGYLGKITDFRRCDKIMGLGIYMIRNIKHNNLLLKGLHTLHEESAYPSPELEYYKENGVSFDIVMGCWGSKTDIRWTKQMFEKEAGVPHYSKYYGCCMKLTEKDRYSFHCKDLEFAKLNCGDDYNIRFNEYNDEGIIEYQKKRAYHSAHISCFINSYARITMMEQLKQFDNLEQIVAVQVDGIYYTGDVEVGSLFAVKKPKSLEWIEGSLYVDENDYSFSAYDNIPDNRTNNSIEVHLGAGGCGKTHDNLIDNGLVDKLFVAPSWKLARNKKKEYGVDSSVFYYLLADDPDRYNPILRYYSTLIIDEISMLSDEAKKLIIKRFPHHKIIFCGDLGFQLPPIEGDEFVVGELPVIHHKKNHRCNDEKLAKVLKKLRRLIVKKGDKYEGEWDKLIGINYVDKDTIDYKVEDLIITKTHDTKDKYTEKYKNLEKYIVVENTRDYSNGEIIYEKPKKVRCEKRHAFTIHSIQGETAQEKLFIDTHKTKSLRMFYTALSRAKTLEQIVLMR